MFKGMKLYTVHVDPDDNGSGIKPVFIKEGFNPLAFVFTLFWALYHQLWALALALFAASFCLMLLSDSQILSEASITALQLGMNVLVGFHANDFLRARLAKKGYILVDVTAADSFLRAQQRYLERYVAAVG